MDNVQRDYQQGEKRKDKHGCMPVVLQTMSCGHFVGRSQYACACSQEGVQVILITLCIICCDIYRNTHYIEFILRQDIKLKRGCFHFVLINRNNFPSTSTAWPKLCYFKMWLNKLWPLFWLLCHYFLWKWFFSSICSIHQQTGSRDCYCETIGSSPW